MKELSLNILDIAENSTKAKAELIGIEISESDDILEIEISDNGYGMTSETLLSVSDPFYTSRTTRKVGMGIPLFRLAAEQTGGRLDISSRHIDEHPGEHGTTVKATFYKNHIDFTPIGDIVSTLVTMIQGHPATDYVFVHRKNDDVVSLDTREIKAILDDVPIDTYDVLIWLRENLKEQYNNLK